ncbi:maleylpyruvate isomerase family mycothiol-dependent enzyme [Kribbella sp.]|uniref:maleylpyruvate isomerase family mycothiol-dependent enzyme n=1 Tax=Kribbella sp. TaxID=1871183 RepID=UPI002D5B3CDE|nr:maleylpyruvate isomerase family mycothiol-dependent enzyme [Kribbella sp.]HZX03332.1 maleylpyruvate isomerase family mycothiol-dependent enzyme [Kribbella sp.]
MALNDVHAIADELLALTADLDDATARGNSVLPGWSRGHVITHVAYFSEAMTRQVDEALQGRLVEVYDGGRPARDAAIEAGADRPAAELKAHLNQAVTTLLASWDKVSPTDWPLPILHRNSNLSAGLQATWRELTIHTSDLDLGITPATWSDDFCLHLLDFLRPRTPDNTHLILRSPATTWESGTGQTVTLEGPLQALTAWYAGRPTPTPITGPTPQLLPWP